MYYLLGFICLSFTWIIYEYRNAPLIEDEREFPRWDDNHAHTEQGF